MCCTSLNCAMGFPGGTVVKILPANEGNTKDTGSIPGLGRSPGVGSGNPLQYSCLGNPKHRGAWRAAVPGVAKGWGMTFPLNNRYNTAAASETPSKCKFHLQMKLQRILSMVLGSLSQVQDIKSGQSGKKEGFLCPESGL